MILFDLRLVPTCGADVHRDFKGTFFPSDGTFALMEVKVLAKGESIVVQADRAKYDKPDFTGYYEEADIIQGTEVEVDNLKYVITKVEGQESIDKHDEYRTGKSTSVIDPLVNKMRNKIRERGAEVMLKLDGKLGGGECRWEEGEVRQALRELGFDCSDEEVRLAIRVCSDGSEEFLGVVRGDMGEARRSLVVKAFRKLDPQRTGFCSSSMLIQLYTPSVHLQSFLQHFPNPDEISYHQFERHYNAVSVAIDSFDQFAVLMHSTWGVE